MIRNKDCDRCSLFRECRNVCIMSDNIDEFDIMLVHSRPNFKADETGKVITSEHDDLVFQVLEQLNVERNTIYETFAVKCLPASKPDTDTIIACQFYIEKEIEQVKPKIIISLGEVALNVLTGLKNITKQRGGIKKALWGDISVLPTFNPYFAKTSETNIELFAKDITTSISTLKGLDLTAQAKTNAVVVTSINQVKELIGYIKETGICAFDVETSGLRYYDEKNVMTSISFSFQPNSAYVIFLYHKSRKWSNETIELIEREFDNIVYTTKENMQSVYTKLIQREGVNNVIDNACNLVKDFIEVFKEDEEIDIPDIVRDAVYDAIDIPETFSDKDIVEIFKLLSDEVFMKSNIIKVAQNFKFDAHWVIRYGVKGFKGRCEDIMLMHYAVKNNRKHGLKGMVENYYPQFGGYENEKDKYTWSNIPAPIQTQYNGIDSDMTLRLSITLLSELLEDERIYLVYRNLLMPICLALLDIEHAGVNIDVVYLEEKIKETENILEELSDKLHSLPKVIEFEKTEFELTKDEMIFTLEDKIEKSIEKNGKKNNHVIRWEKELEGIKTAQIQPKLYKKVTFGTVSNKLKRLFFDEHGFGFDEPYDWKKRQKVKSIRKDFMPLFKDDTGFIDGIKQINSIRHTLGTFLKSIYGLLDKSGKLHTSYKQLIDTGRISSAEPNLQNIPPEGRNPDHLASRVTGFVKKSFIAPKDHVFVEVDFSQAELRMIAMYANETNMLNIYADDGDLHAATAAKMMGLTIEDFYKLDKKEIKNKRFEAKSANFGLIYGLSSTGYKAYAEQTFNLILTRDEAEEQRNLFFDTYPRLLDYHDKYIQKCVKNGGVRTLLGYKRFIDDIYEEDGFKRNHAENQAVNTPIQGTAGQLTLLSIVLLKRRLDKRVQIVNTVHDSVHFYIPKDILKDSARIIKNTMENLPLEDFYLGAKIEGVKMKVDFSISDKGWGYLEEVEFNNLIN